MLYFDHHAGTPLCPAATEAMAEAAMTAWANPSSVHGPGRAARGWLERARRQVAEAMGAVPADVVLTGGGTEACNLGILGLGVTAPGVTSSGAQVRPLTTSVEHPAVSETIRRLAGADGPTVLAVPDGRPPTADEVASHLVTGGTTLFACQWVNHETGTVLPVADYAEVCRRHRVLCFIDATQAAGKLPIDVAELGADGVALASHKFGGPAGAGALWLRRGLELSPLLGGGGQERGRRPGTPDVVSLAGFGAACAALPERLAAQAGIADLRDRLEGCLIGLGAVINGAGGPRVATVVNGSFEALRGDQLVAALDVEGLACASGAACSSGLAEPSPVIAAMYPGAPLRARGALRLSLGPETCAADVERATGILDAVVGRMRKLR